MKILTICPTIYPNKFEKMYHSYSTTTSKYNKLLIINKLGSITKLLNEAFERNPDYEYYHITNDDVIYETPLWDTTLSNKYKISYGDDKFQRENLCTFPCIDGDIIRSVGWLQMPTLERYYGDNCWYFIGKQLGIMNYVPSVTIKHNWEGADIDIYKADTQKFAEWLPYSHKDIEKIKRVL